MTLELTLKRCASPLSGYCQISFLNYNRKEVRIQKLHFRDISSTNDTVVFEFPMERSPEVGNRLRVICRIAVAKNDPSCNSNVARRLSQELSNLFNRERFNDAILYAGGQEFKAHRSILAAFSPVFNAIFSNDLEESKSGRVELTDVSAEVVEEMLNFMYTGKSVLEQQTYYDGENRGIDQNLAIGLLQVADKYQLDKLKVICEDALADSLTEESVNKILALSCLHRTSSLKHQCIEFINSHTKEFIKHLTASGGFLREALS